MVGIREEWFRAGGRCVVAHARQTIDRAAAPGLALMVGDGEEGGADAYQSVHLEATSEKITVGVWGVWGLACLACLACPGCLNSSSARSNRPVPCLPLRGKRLQAAVQVGLTGR